MTDTLQADTAGEEVWNYIMDALWQAIAGDATDTSNALGILLSVGVGLIPYVGQIADARDVIADIVNLCTDGAETEEWVALGFSIVGFIPGLGDFLKHGDETASVVSKVLKNVDNVDEIAEAVKGTMKKGEDVYKKYMNKIDEVIESDDLLRSCKKAKNYITSRCEKYANKFADATKFNETVDKSIRALGKYADNVVKEYLDRAEQYSIDKMIEGTKNGRENAIGQY